MKYYIITIHCIPNFGSVFQSYGLAEYLRKLGKDVEIIDYRPFYYKEGRRAFKNFVAKLLNFRSYKLQAKNYKQFVARELPLTKDVYRDKSALQRFNTIDAVFISGGDQIWNSVHPSGKDDAYKLSFLDEQRRIAFGSSMGRNSFSEDELKALAAQVQKYSFIGLREQSTVSLLAKYVNFPVHHVVDPVLLLEKSEYARFVGEEPIIKEPYLVMYLSRPGNLLDEVIKFIAKKYNLKVVQATGFKKKCKCDYHFKSTGPDEILNLIYYSQFVVSASYHATLFSLLFGKQFCTLLPEAGTNTRIEDLLSYYNMKDRIITRIEDISNLESIIEFDEVQAKMDNIVKNSKALLNNAL